MEAQQAPAQWFAKAYSQQRSGEPALKMAGSSTVFLELEGLLEGLLERPLERLLQGMWNPPFRVVKPLRGRSQSVFSAWLLSCQEAAPIPPRYACRKRGVVLMSPLLLLGADL